MRNPQHVIVKSVRCFATGLDIPLAPLTFLVGDNSSGKSTFLAVYRIAWDLAFTAGRKRINFNEEPFLLGGYDQIATYRGGRAGRAGQFSIGMRVPGPRRNKLNIPSDGELDLEIIAKFEQSGSHPVITEEQLSYGPIRLTVTRPVSESPMRIDLEYQNKIHALQIDEIDTPLRFVERDAPSDLMLLGYFLSDHTRKSKKGAANGAPAEALELLDMILRSRRFRGPDRPIACAPVRTKPERVYSPISDSPAPEGGHVPMVLARLFFEDKPKWEKLKENLDEYGNRAGLFKSIEIKSLGRHEGDPFQLRFRLDGPPTNLLDMGYGVSQVLPILVDALLAKPDQTYLLQQPEVHLHPKGQAALGTFLGGLTAGQHRRFIVETHSDFMIDRVSMDIRDGKGISAEDAQILFFDRSAGDVVVHRISFDKRGGLVDAPPSYRKFFLEEERRYLIGES